MIHKKAGAIPLFLVTAKFSIISSHEASFPRIIPHKLFPAAWRATNIHLHELHHDFFSKQARS
ncbi:hypothetical protein B4168_0193 [Anoxybacillus flavithermus]|nr:hypothetical protein B4168_0193 [Anoxybacillus flavithermus]OAO88889.1 hypothetical protein GT23_0129 [Parageobacillus thermoglucosidasius]